MKLLVVGNGGREHAFVDRLRRDAPEARLFAAPGNPGMASLARLVPIGSDDIDGLADFARDERIDLTIVGPEAPLAAGLANRFQTRDLPVFGPTAAGARLEASKAFAKALMREHGVPTASYETFQDPSAAHSSRYS